MKDIKFKAYVKNENKIGCVVAIDWSDNQIISCHIEFDNEGVKKYYPEPNGYGDDVEFLEYTYSKDKNNVEIYEGYILEDDNGKKYEVARGVNSCGFIARTNEIHGNVYSLYHLSFKTRIIGNVYMNPDLRQIVKSN